MHHSMLGSTSGNDKSNENKWHNHISQYIKTFARKKIKMEARVEETKFNSISSL